MPAKCLCCWCWTNLLYLMSHFRFLQLFFFLFSLQHNKVIRFPAMLPCRNRLVLFCYSFVSLCPQIAIRQQDLERSTRHTKFDPTGFELMTSRSWQYISYHWEACSSHLAVVDFSYNLLTLALKNILQRYLLNLKETAFVSLGLSAQWGLSLCEWQSTTMEWYSLE